MSVTLIDMTFIYSTCVSFFPGPGRLLTYLSLSFQVSGVTEFVHQVSNRNSLWSSFSHIVSSLLIVCRPHSVLSLLPPRPLSLSLSFSLYIFPSSWFIYILLFVIFRFLFLSSICFLFNKFCSEIYTSLPFLSICHPFTLFLSHHPYPPHLSDCSLSKNRYSRPWNQLVLIN